MLKIVVFLSKFVEKILHLSYSKLKRPNSQLMKKIRGKIWSLLRGCCTLRGIVLEPLLSQTQSKHVVQVNWADRWQVYLRLQELGIQCWCETNQSLTVEISSTLAAIQLWSVMQQFTVTRKDLIRNLEFSWHCA